MLLPEPGKKVRLTDKAIYAMKLFSVTKLATVESLDDSEYPIELRLSDGRRICVKVEEVEKV